MGKAHDDRQQPKEGGTSVIKSRMRLVMASLLMPLYPGEFSQAMGKLLIPPGILRSGKITHCDLPPGQVTINRVRLCGVILEKMLPNIYMYINIFLT